MDGVRLLAFDWPAFIHRLPDNIHDAPQRGISYRHLDEYPQHMEQIERQR